MTDSATRTFHMKRDPMILSYSGIQMFLTCRNRWRLLNVYNIQPERSLRPMDLGSAVHAAMETYLKSEGSIERGIDVWLQNHLSVIPDDVPFETVMEENARSIAADAVQIATRLCDEIERRGLRTLYHDGVPLVETELSIPFDGWDAYAAHLDWICYDPSDKTVWIVDFKVRKTFYGEETESTNLQNASYQYMASKALGIPIDGTLTFQVRSSVPKRPKVNKDRSISRTKIVTDWKTYRDVIIENGQDPADYDDMRQALDVIEWTNVIKAYRSAEHVARIWEKIIIPIGVEMSSIRDELQSKAAIRRKIGGNRAYRNLNPHRCHGCPVRDTCLNALRGWDVPEQDSRGDLFRIALKEKTL